MTSLYQANPPSLLSRQAIAAELEAHGLKPTDQRLRVAEILMRAPAHLRGRVMSIFFLNRGMLPLGTLGAGVATEFIGVQWTVSIMASLLVLLGIIMFFRSPEVREIA